MADKREQILVRLREIGASISGIATAIRNEGNLDETMLPAFMLLDADEAADDSDPKSNRRGLMAPRRVTMTPEMYVILGSKPENVGTILNGFRLAIYKAVMTDATLIGILGPNGFAFYEGCQTSLAAGREMIGDLGISISYSYILNPAEL